MKESIAFRESLKIISKGSEVLLNHTSGRIIGEVEALELDMMGNVVFSYGKEYNDVILTGSTFVLEQMFKQRAPINISTLSEDMDINGDIELTTENLKDEYVFGFMVGIGGVSEMNEGVGIVNAVQYTDKTLATMLPFRVVNSELEGQDAENYFMKKYHILDGDTEERYSYYAKKFTGEPVIKHLFTDGSEVPPNISETGTDRSIRTFTEMTCDVNAQDIRDYFNIKYQSLDNCRVNTIGLVAGFKDDESGDMAGARLVTAINFKNRELNNTENTIRFIYRIYCI